ncbi:hypothetical protein MTBPR1_70016 [Candidatus Terasakiella magnetica]|uniref:Uncharacterized protein n=1 Tax=Candidatus Terasakiella magnetica TaxID=1867952 RepID=A0A1C3RKA5_9PROT|nr:hypothetical protein [Candidatus Terasakiella magnetica]SCA57744.1 hypothetical protein MTBPR1_70016 [Candidatus Terasakiella magnetica]
MSKTIDYKEFVDYRAKLNQAVEDIAKDKKSAASNRIRAVKKHLDDWEGLRAELNCESLGRLNHLQKMVREIEAEK